MIRRHSSRSGSVVFANLFAVLAIGLLLAALWNASAAVHAKLDAQNDVDGVTESAAIQLARGMNQLTAITHALGELNARCVLAYTPGGAELEGGTRFDMSDAQDEVDVAFAAALWARSRPDYGVYRKMGARAGASGAAIGAARNQLKHLLALSFLQQAALGRRGDKTAVLRQQAALLAEWELLDQLEATAREKLVPLKTTCDRVLIPEYADQARRVVEQSPRRAEAVAREVGTRYGVSGSVAGVRSGAAVELPAVPDTATGARSQIVRATTPWVQYLRQPTLTFARARLPLSGYESHYRAWSNRFTLDLSAARSSSVYVLRDATGDKGREPWAVAGGAARVDELFGVVGQVRYPAPFSIGRTAFAAPRPDGSVTAAEARLYNANPQEPDRVDSRYPASLWQPVIGYDTLNFDPAVRVPEFEYGLRADAGPLERPLVRLNWRVLLVPAAHTEIDSGSPGWWNRTH